jgi:DNA-binding response OmpR family regulator
MLKGNQIRIGVIDDDEDDFFIIKDYIREIEDVNFVIDWLNSYQTAIAKIKPGPIIFIFLITGWEMRLDWNFCRKPWRCNATADCVIDRKGNKAIDIKAMQSGATDYLVKSELNAEKLERCIRYHLTALTQYMN